MTRSARRLARPLPARRRAPPALGRRGTAVSEPGEASAAAVASNGAAPTKVKPGRHREATLYRALAGAGAGDGPSLAPRREDAAAAFKELELPVWRRSGFWTTTLQNLDLDALRGDAG